MLVQELDKRFVSTPPLNQRRHIMNNVERVRPHVTLGPSLVLTGPGATSIACLHETGGIVEYRERCGECAIAEECGVVGLAKRGSEDRHSVVII